MKTDIVIEKGVPIPAVKKRRMKYPWMEMAVGDSFVFPYDDMHSATVNVYTANRRYKPKTFKTGRDADGQIRVWRIA